MLGLFVLLVGLSAVNGAALYDSVDRIVNGEDANEGEYPFMVSLRAVKMNYKHSCGATILTKNWVLTAAHCLRERGPNDVIITSDTIYLDRGGTNHTVEKVIRHERHDKGPAHREDIGVIRVKDPFVFGKNVQPVTLPKKCFVVNSGDKLATAGWGRTQKDGHASNRLQKAEAFDAISSKECANVTQVEMYPGFLCARGDVGQSSCYGDSGGPLLKNGVQVGITSFGKPPCKYPSPNVFSRVSHFIDWIVEKLGPDAADLKFSE